MRRMFKYELDITDEQTVTAPRGWRPFAAQLQAGVLCLWAEVDDSDLQVDHSVFVHGTGHPVNPAAETFVDTFQLPDTGLVFHVFAGR